MVKQGPRKRGRTDTGAATDIQMLLDKLDFAPEEVVVAAARQPILFLRAAQYRIELMRRRVQAEMASEDVRAHHSLGLRRDARESGDRVTEGNLVDQLAINKNVRRAQEVASAAVEAEEFAKLLLEAYRMRRDCLKIVGELTGAELAMRKLAEAGAERLAGLKQKLVAKYPGERG